jgi:uncharacterized protein (TIGR02118 family)
MQNGYKFTTIYRKVDDEQQLEAFFSQTHLPLAEQLPYLVKRELSRITYKPGGQSRFYLMLELYFNSQAHFNEAILSEPGVQLIQALTPWAEAKIISWYFAECFEEAMEGA